MFFFHLTEVSTTLPVAKSWKNKKNNRCLKTPYNLWVTRVPKGELNLQVVPRQPRTEVSGEEGKEKVCLYSARSPPNRNFVCTQPANCLCGVVFWWGVVVCSWCFSDVLWCGVVWFGLVWCKWSFHCVLGGGCFVVFGAMVYNLFMF